MEILIESIVIASEAEQSTSRADRHRAKASRFGSPSDVPYEQT
jgi:hypothetical protein